MLASTLLPTTGYGALDWLVYMGAAVGAAALIWRTVVRPTMRTFSKIDEYGPVLTEIARQFKSDSGSTLKDIITRIEKVANANLEAIKAIEAWNKVEAATLAEVRAAVRVLRGRLK